ncbi:MAG: hypothetical protein H8D23_38320 [Candidatus Brocadiales bacterium]|nr:hypothetical protein [Candidatus Brocadiales bacterium]
MKFYAIDTDGRTIIYFILAFVAVGCAFAISYLGQFHEYLKATAPSALMIYICLIAIFDKYIWKWNLVNVLVGIPVLEGNWEGVLTRTDVNNETTSRQVKLVVTQTWRKMALVFNGERSVSDAQVISLFNSNENSVRIKWIYVSRDLSGIEHKNLYGEGTTDLLLSVNGNSKQLIGVYYSTKLKKGRIELKYKGETHE